MGFKRSTTPRQLPKDESLTAALVGIGMNFASAGARDPNIEDTLFAASVEGLERDDLRVLSMLVTWLEVHHPWINADRLVRGAQSLGSPRVRAFWAAAGAWLQQKDRRFTKLVSLYQGSPLDLLRAGNAFQVARRGEDERFAESPLRVPKGTLRKRPADVLSPSQLAKTHAGYRHRILMGPSYRADMWAALTQDPSLSAAELARLTYGSFATAWQIKQDWAVLQAA